MVKIVCRIINLSHPNLGVLCALARVNARPLELQQFRDFAQAAKTLNYSSLAPLYHARFIYP